MPLFWKTAMYVYKSTKFYLLRLDYIDLTSISHFILSPNYEPYCYCRLLFLADQRNVESIYWSFRLQYLSIWIVSLKF